MRNILNNTLALLKIGSGIKLFLFDIIVWVIIVIDFISLKTNHIDIYRWPQLTVQTLVVAVAVIYIPPLVSAFIDFFFRNVGFYRKVKLFPHTLASKWRDYSFVFHFFTSVVLSLFISISTELEVNSGFQANYTGSTTQLTAFQYAPFYKAIVYVVLGSGLLGVFISLISFFGYSKELKEEFILWFKLSNSSSEYFPKQKASLIFVNTASMAPTINAISTEEESHRHTYQKKVPTSDDAKKYLMRAAGESRDLLVDYLFQDTDRQSHFSIEFLPGTSRALEVGLTQIDNLGTIIVSPYEHPSQNDVVKWFVAAFNPSVKHKNLKMDYSILHGSWDEQKSQLLSQIQPIIEAQTDGKKVAILISEVHYLTGMVINVNEIIQQLRPNFRSSSLVFMVDGSQSVGNLLRPLSTLANNLHREDFYYFSAHKWLLSPNTCGVFIAEQNPSRYKIQPYDIFTAELLPSATVDPGVIFGIRSSLNYLIGNKMSLLKKFHETSCLLKSYFIENIGEQFEAIESASKEMNGSLFIAVRPQSGNRWKEATREDFWTQITRDGVDLSLLELQGIEPKNWWLRISFPYFLQLHQLKQLIKHLQARVASINQ